MCVCIHIHSVCVCAVKSFGYIIWGIMEIYGVWLSHHHEWDFLQWECNGDILLHHGKLTPKGDDDPL